MKRKDLKRTFKLLPHEEAQHRLLNAAHIKPLGHEEVALEGSVGRVLAEDVISRVNIPVETRAVFDGYAIRSTDSEQASVRNPIFLEIVGKTFPDESPLEISSGQAVFTACGAPVPKGADAIVKTENVRLLEDKIEIRSPVKPGEKIALAGEDVKKGSLIAKKGHFLRPQDAGLLAGTGLRTVKVFKKPKVGIISCGDELIKLNNKEPDRIANNYALIVSSLVSDFGGTPLLFGIAPDNIDEVKKKLSEALEKTDIVATIAGCSVGPKDLVPDAVNALGKPGVVFQGVKLSPGRVMGAGIVNSKPVVMLPGYIVSAYAGFYLLLAPLIAQFIGLGREFPLPVVRAKLTEDIKARPTATFLRLHLTCTNGEYEGKSVHGGAGALNSLINSHGYTIVQAGKELKKGTFVKVALYDKYEFAHILIP